MMITEKFDLFGEQTSPLFRIMWATNLGTPNVGFDSNVCAFHIGNGLILTVGHVLRSPAPIIRTISDAEYAGTIVPSLNADEQLLFDRCYIPDPPTNCRYASIQTEPDAQGILKAFKRIGFDTRLLTLTARAPVKPYLIIQFTEDLFYGDAALNGLFPANTHFRETSLSRFTYLIEVEFVEGFWAEDIALFRIVNTEQEIIEKIPSIEVDFATSDDDRKEMYCLQGDPSGTNLGRLLNTATIEGYLDHHAVGPDLIDSYLLEGFRYLVKGYFRFGSSGAPYVIFDRNTASFKVNAIQSEASPIQMAIAGSHEGNLQYINAIASPLKSVEDRLLPYLV